MSTFTPFAEKMESAGVSAAAVNAFSRCYEALVSNHSGMIPETDILPADQVEDWQDITASTPRGGQGPDFPLRMHQAQRRPRHEHGPPEGEKPAENKKERIRSWI